MNFTAKHLDYEISVSFWEGVPTFTCREVFPSRNFSSHEKLIEALDAYNLKLRKSFTNPTAWRMGERYGVGPKLPRQVTVTSIVEGGKMAWIKTQDGRREQVNIESLCADKEAVLAALAAEEKAKKEVEDAWAACPNWTPRWKEAPDGAL